VVLGPLQDLEHFIILRHSFSFSLLFSHEDKGESSKGSITCDIQWNECRSEKPASYTRPDIKRSAKNVKQGHTFLYSFGK
jgi:hypothetical protein